MNDIKQQDVPSRVAEDTVGASFGAAGGAVLATIAGAVVPIASVTFPVVAVVGALGGVLVKEIAQRKRKKANASQITKP